MTSTQAKHYVMHANACISLLCAGDDEFIVKLAESEKKAKELAEVGFEYVAEVYGKPMFRKRK
jgi:hypothetical protein